MVRIPDSNNPSVVSLGRNTPSNLTPVGSPMNNPFADAIEGLGRIGRVVGNHLEAEDKRREAEERAAAKQREEVLKQKTASYLEWCKTHINDSVNEYVSKNPNQILDKKAIEQIVNKQMADVSSAESLNRFGLQDTADLRDARGKIGYSVLGAGYNDVNRQNASVEAKNIVEAQNTASKDFVRNIADGKFENIGFDASSFYIAKQKQGFSSDAIGQNLNDLMRDGVKGYVLNSANDVNKMYALLSGGVKFSDFRTGEQLTYQKLVGDADYEKTLAVYHNTLENELARTAMPRDSFAIRKALAEGGMYKSAGDVTSAVGRVVEKAKNYQTERARVLAEEDRQAWSNIFRGDTSDTERMSRFDAIVGKSIEYSAAHTREEERLKKESENVGFFDFQKKREIETIQTDIDIRKANAMGFINSSVWGVQPLNAPAIFENQQFADAKENQKDVLDAMFQRTKYDNIVANMPAGIDVEAMIGKAVSSYKSEVGKDILQPEVRRLLSDTLQNVAQNDGAVSEAVGKAVARAYGNFVLKTDADRSAADKFTKIVQDARLSKAVKSSKEELWVAVRDELLNEYDESIVKDIMPYIINGEYNRAGVLANALERRPN